MLAQFYYSYQVLHTFTVTMPDDTAEFTRVFGSCEETELMQSTSHVTLCFELLC